MTVAGLVLAATTAWWLVAVGVFCIIGAWFYTGGKKPYGYSGFGEIAVFIFFGLIAVLGTQFVQAERVDLAGLAMGSQSQDAQGGEEHVSFAHRSCLRPRKTRRG